MLFFQYVVLNIFQAIPFPFPERSIGPQSQFQKFFAEKCSFPRNLYKAFQTHLIVVVMKRLNLFGAIALAAVVLTASPAVNAQENGNRDEYGKVVRGPYETNRFGDNWFIGVGGGINSFWTDGYKMKVAPSIDASVGKWFTPSVGMRIGYSGFMTKLNMAPEKFDYMYVHGDFLWNMSNAFSGYKDTRFWNLVPYLHAGWYRAYDKDVTILPNNELAVGGGLLHNLRLADRLDLIIDMKAIIVNGRVMGASGIAVQPSVTAGLAVDLGFPNFVRTSTVIGAVELAQADQVAALQAAAVALELANANLEGDIIKLQKTNKNLNAQVADLKKKQTHEMDAAEFFKGMSPVPIYFNIGATTLTTDELAHLDFVAKNIVAKADKCPKVYITVMGSADSNTGTAKRNAKLSEARGKYIADLLTTKYGISKDKLVVKSEVVKAAANPELARAVKITF